MIPLDLIPARDNRLPALIVLLLVVIVPFFAWHENTSGFYTDDAMYLLLADFFSPFHDGNIFVEHIVAAQSRFPPTFPVLIGLLGGGSDNMPVAHLVTASCFIASAVLLYVWSRRILRPDVALACLAVYILLPRTIFYINEVRSEFLYIALVFAVFAVLRAAPLSRRHQRELWIVAAFLVGLSILTRTIGVALFAAFALHLYLEKIPRKTLHIGIATVLPVAWLVIKSLSGYSGNYTEDLQRYLDPTGISKLLLNDIPRNASLIAQTWQQHLAVESDSPQAYQLLSLALLGLGIAGAASRLWRRRVDAVYFFIYLPPILVWPHPSHIARLIYPLVPLLMVYVFVGIHTILSPWAESRTRAAHFTAVFALLLLVYPNALNIVERFSAPVPKHIPTDFRHTRTWLQDRDFEKVYLNVETKHNVITLMKRIEGHLNETECMYAVHPVSAILYANRTANLISSNPVLAEMTHCNYLFVMNLIGQFKAMYPLEVVNLDQLQLIDMERNTQGKPQAMLFRIKR